MTRTRTISWHDPVDTARQAHGLTGLEALHRIGNGLLPPPPVADLVGFHPIFVSPGYVVFGYEPREEHYNTLGADSAPVTIELKTSFVRPVTLASGLLRAEGSIVHPGSRVATAEAKLLDEEGTLFAHASSSWLIHDAARKEKKEPIAA